MPSKLQQLETLLRDLKSVVVSFSGGVDSTFLLAVAKRVLDDKVLAVIGRSPTYPGRELREAVELAEGLGARYRIEDTNELENPDFSSNPPTRCYHCKTTLLGVAQRVARDEGMSHVVEGSNADDVGDFRPGMQAAAELGVRSPLREVGLTKEEIRTLSKKLELPTWDKPAMACLSSRIPYGETISRDRLARIEKAEDALWQMGMRGFRVRDHGEVARVEVHPGLIREMAGAEERRRIVAALKEAGYKYVALDLEGYRTGAMNEVLSKDRRLQAARGEDR